MYDGWCWLWYFIWIGTWYYLAVYTYPKKCSAIADAIATPLLAFGSIVVVLDSTVDTLVNGPVNDGSIMVNYTLAVGILF